MQIRVRMNMMDDLISRQSAIDALNDEFTITGKTNAVIVQDYIRRVSNRLHDLSPAQPEQKGRWIPIQRAFFSKEVVQVKCSECGNLLDLIGVNCGRGDANYCPNCGAKMEVEDDRS